MYASDIFCSFLSPPRSDGESNDEMADEELNKLVIVTQTPPHLKKHPSGDRTGSYQSRAKMSTDLAEVINDGLLCYEQVSVLVACTFFNPLCTALVLKMTLFC